MTNSASRRLSSSSSGSSTGSLATSVARGALVALFVLAGFGGGSGCSDDAAGGPEATPEEDASGHTTSDAGATLEDAAATEDAAADADFDANDGAKATLRQPTLKELADQSADDYAANEHGLIAGSRAKSWIDNWNANRPSGIEGKLVILQVGSTSANSEAHVPANEAAGVYSYFLDASELNKPRSNGLSAFETDIPDGATADAWLKKYGIDPRKDFVLLTFEQRASTASSIVQSVGRAWVFLKYWGFSKEHVGVLNGSVNWNATNQALPLVTAVTANISTPPDNGTVSVRDLGVDQTHTTISLQELVAILKKVPGAPLLSAVRIVDARGGAEALGLKKATSTGRTDCASHTGTAPNAKCSTPFEGRIKGAKSVPWTQFLDTADGGFRFLPKDALKAIFDAQAGWDGTAQLTIQYCRTNQRSTVTGLVANVILGYPTRLYETSFIEWGHVATGVVDDDFPFRTDLPELTEHAELAAADLGAYTPGGTLGVLTQPVTWVAGPNYNDPNDVSPASPSPYPTNAAGWPKLDKSATTTRLSIDTDRAYLRAESLADFLSNAN